MSKNKRRIYLINPKFQLKFSILACLAICISSLIYPLTIHDLFSALISYAHDKVPESASFLEEKKKALTLFLIFWQLAFTTAIFVICIIFSHKIAGPLYKLKMHLQKFRRGDSSQKLTFRKGDYFQEIADEINLTLHGEGHSDEIDDVKHIEDIKSYLNNLSIVIPEDKRIVLTEIISKLSEIQKKLERLS